MSNATRTLWIVEPQYRNLEGHHSSWTASVGRAARAAGFDVVVCTAAAILPEARERLEDLGFEVDAFFTDPALHAPVPVKAVHYFTEYLRGLRALRDRVSGDDIVLTMSANPDLAAAGALADSFGWLRCPVVIQFFAWDYYLLESSPRVSARATALVRRGWTTLLRRSPGPRLIICGQTEPIARAIGRRVGRTLGNLPFPVEWEVLGEATRTVRSPVVGYLGGARREKGFHYFCAALESLDDPPSVYAQVFLARDYDPQEHEARVARLRELDSELVEAPLVGSAFGDAFRSLDILVLPYSAEYAERNSSLLAEAIGMGRVPVAPRGTWLGDVLVDSGLGVTYDPDAPQGLADAIRRAVDEHDELRAAVMESVAAWRGAHSPSGYIAALTELADSSARPNDPTGDTMATRSSGVMPSLGLRRAARNLKFEATCFAKHVRGSRKARRVYGGQTGLRLNVGCGPNIRDGWVNIDLSKRADVTLDLREPLPFDDGSCAFIYSEHFFEHLDYPGDATAFLRESFRVLASGGTFSVGVPDTEWPLREYAGVDDEGYFESVREHWHPDWCETRMEHLNYHFRQDDEHRFAYDFETLEHVLSRAGFVDIVRRPFDPDLDDEARSTGTLYVDAKKP